MEKRTFLKGALQLVATTSLAGLIATGAQAIEPRKLTYATYIPDTYALVKVDKWFMDEVTKRTDGAITFEPYYNGTLLTASDMLPGIAAGAADMGNSVPSVYNRADYPLSNITLPFITERVDSVSKAFKALYEENEAFRKEYEDKGIRLLYDPAYGENTLWSTKPVAKPDDVNGLRVRAVLAIGDALADLGASTVAIPWNEALEGMQRGVVDAMSAAPFDTAVAGGLPEVAPYGSDVGRMGVYAVSATVLNVDTWSKLEPEVQDIFNQVAAEVPDYYIGLLNKTVDEAAQKVADRVKSEELTLQRFSDADRQAIIAKAGAPIEKAWIEKADTAGVDGTAVLKQYKDLVTKFDEESAYTPGFDRVEALTK